MNDFFVDFPTAITHRMSTVFRTRTRSEEGSLSPVISSLLTGILLFLCFFLFMALVQFSTPDMPDNDGYYHIKLASLMRTEGLVPDFPWLPMTILNEREFYDHHFLFHVALIPFTLGDLRVGAKWASVVFSSIAFLCVWWLLHKQRIPHAWIWALGLLAVSEAFIYRMSVTRAQTLSLAVLAVSLHFMFTGKHKWLIVLGFLYVWLYDAFPLLLIFSGLYVFSNWLLDGKVNFSPLAYSAAGIALGMLFNPYFPFNIVFTIQHILPKLSDATSVRVGNEWYPYKTSQLLENSGLAFLAFISGVIALGLSGRKMSVQTATSLLAAIVTGLMLMQARRFVEYFPVFALVFAAFAWSDFIQNRREKELVFNTTNTEQKIRSPFLESFRNYLTAFVLLIFLIPGVWLTLNGAQASINHSKPYQLYLGASAWLEQHTPTGSRVFQTDWDDFPRLFFYNTHNTYIVGLDPTYLQLFDEDLYDTWVSITRGHVENPSGLIVGRFGAHYIITDLKHENFLREAQNDPDLVEVYRDDLSAVFAVSQ